VKAVEVCGLQFFIIIMIIIFLCVFISFKDLKEVNAINGLFLFLKKKKKKKKKNSTQHEDKSILNLTTLDKVKKYKIH